METVRATTDFNWVNDGDIIRHVIFLIADHGDSISKVDYELFFNAWHDNICGSDDALEYQIKGIIRLIAGAIH